MVCERCGNEMQDNATICPVCGTVNTAAKSAAQPSTGYGQYSQHGFGEPSSYQPGKSSYASQPGPTFRSQINYAAQQQQEGYAPPYNPPGPPHVSPGNGMTLSNKNDQALVTEIILSLFGLFGVGWLVAGETTVGIILLVCSIFIYWPIMIGGTILTFGLGLICLGPIAIAAIILNTILLNRTLNRKATRFVLMQHPPHMHVPHSP